MAVGDTLGVVLATRTDQLTHLHVHELVHGGQAEPDRERQQALLGRAGKLAQRDGHLLRKLERKLSRVADDVRTAGYGFHERSPPFGLDAPFLPHGRRVEDRS
ncbi:MAG: hypothetical protein ACYDB4_13615 [Candidatus Dormibacteraceae bacterium]